MFKSGTSLLRTMIGQHSGIASGLETYWFELQWEHKDEQFWKRIGLLGKFYDLEREYARTLVDECHSVEEFLNRFLGAYTDKMSARRWAEKTPGNIKYMDRIFAQWPDAQVIHIMRDPRDVLASLRQAGKWDSVDEFCDMWREFFERAEECKANDAFKNDRYMEIRYEDLVFSPVSTMKDVIGFLNEPWEDSVAEFSGSRSDYEKVLSLTGKASTTLDRLGFPLMNKRVGIWHSILDPEEVDSLEEAFEKANVLDIARGKYFNS